jgi:hypothetical protein
VVTPDLLTGTTIFRPPISGSQSGACSGDAKIAVLTLLDALREVCFHRGWSLRASRVRTNHADVAVEADVRPRES